MTDNNIYTVIIIGGGLVGSLCACFMAKRGYKVILYEYREDLRSSVLQRGKSINLALSNRGRSALRAVGLEEIVLQAAIPMKGRLLHSLSGQTKSVLYDANNHQCIYSVGRNYLNQVLLTAAEKYFHVKLYFNHKLTDANLREGAVTILNIKTGETFSQGADLIIGADGAFSALRRAMQQTCPFNYNQTYIEHGYIELSIPQERGNKMIPNHLHIWPRNDFMMIALPNLNKSWTVTLFMPFKKFDDLNSEDRLLDFFKSTFPDALPLIGEQDLINDFLKSKPSYLISIKCYPYHIQDKFLIIGDAAHAMVPFYGQGMNAGFEDCIILDDILNLNDGNIGLAIRDFSDKRHKDAHAICDLAMYNYVEMRDLVTHRTFYLRKIFDNLLFRLLSNKWIPLYNSVTFSSMGYNECLENSKIQNKIIQKCTWSIALLSIIFLYVLYYYPL